MYGDSIHSLSRCSKIIFNFKALNINKFMNEQWRSLKEIIFASLCLYNNVFDSLPLAQPNFYHNDQGLTSSLTIYSNFSKAITTQQQHILEEILRKSKSSNKDIYEFDVLAILLQVAMEVFYSSTKSNGKVVRVNIEQLGVFFHKWNEEGHPNEDPPNDNPPNYIYIVWTLKTLFENQNLPLFTQKIFHISDFPKDNFDQVYRMIDYSHNLDQGQGENNQINNLQAVVVDLDSTTIGEITLAEPAPLAEPPKVEPMRCVRKGSLELRVQREKYQHKSDESQEAPCRNCKCPEILKNVSNIRYQQSCICQISSKTADPPFYLNHLPIAIIMSCQKAPPAAGPHPPIINGQQPQIYSSLVDLKCMPV